MPDFIYDMSRSFLDTLRAPMRFAGMGRVVHSWADQICEVEGGSILAAVPHQMVRETFRLVPELSNLDRRNLLPGLPDPVQLVAGNVLCSLREKPANRCRLIRSAAYRAFRSRQDRQVSAAVSAFSRKSNRFVYHNPLTAPLPRNLPESCVPVVSIYDIMPFVFRDTYPPITRRDFSHAVATIFRHKAHVIVNSEDTKHSLVCFFNMTPSRIHVVPLGSDPAWKAGDGTLPVGVAEPFALYVAGSNQRRKNLATTVEGFCKFTDMIAEPAQLVIVGGGTEAFQAEADALAKTSKASVRCLGSVDEGVLGDLYSRAKVGLYSSLYEGFGLPVLECMGKGLPLVCGNRTSLPEAAGDAAIQVEASNPGAIAIGLAKLWQNENLRDSMSVMGLRRSQEMSWEASAKKLLEVYAQILEA